MNSERNKKNHLLKFCGKLPTLIPNLHVSKGKCAYINIYKNNFIVKCIAGSD